MADWETIGLDGVRSYSRLLRFDRTGTLLSPDTLAHLLDDLRQHAACRIVLISHGWNNDFGEAVDLYSHFMRGVEALGDPSGRNLPMAVVGVIWPSSWAPRDDGPAIAAQPAGASTDPADPARMLLDRLDDPDRRRRVDALMAKRRLSAEEAAALAGDVAEALAREDREDRAEAGEGRPGAADILVAMHSLSTAVAGRDYTADWGSPPSTAEAAARLGAPAAAGLRDIDPLMAVRAFSVYLMKDRAGRVGASGVRALLADLIATGHPVHGVGHSFGCKVLLSALCGGAPPSRPMESLLLLQPAISHLSFAASVPGREGSGGYRAALATDHVRQPLRSTYSRWDRPLHTIFHLALRRKKDLGELLAAAGPTAAGDPPSVYAALGGYGPRGSGEALIEPLPRAGEPDRLPAGHRLYAFDGTLDRRITGHGDVCTDMTAWAFVQQIAAAA